MSKNSYVSADRSFKSSQAQMYSHALPSSKRQVSVKKKKFSWFHKTAKEAVDGTGYEMLRAESSL